MKAVHALFVLMVLVLYAPLPSLTLSCVPCNEVDCPPVSCKGSKVLGVCACCQVCAKVRGEICGGPFGIDGECDKGLECNKDPNDFNASGICVGTGRCADFREHREAMREWKQVFEKWTECNRDRGC